MDVGEAAVKVSAWNYLGNKTLRKTDWIEREALNIRNQEIEAATMGRSQKF